MKCFRITSKEKYIYLQNLERIDELETFSKVQEVLSKADANFGELIKLPEGDIIKGTIDDVVFTVFMDLYDGIEIQCDAPKTLDKIQRILEQE